MADKAPPIPEAHQLRLTTPSPEVQYTKTVIKHPLVTDLTKTHHKKSKSKNTLNRKRRRSKKKYGDKNKPIDLTINQPPRKKPRKHKRRHPERHQHQQTAKIQQQQQQHERHIQKLCERQWKAMGLLGIPGLETFYQNYKQCLVFTLYLFNDNYCKYVHIYSIRKRSYWIS